MFLRREEWVEDFLHVLGFDAAAIVADFKFDVVALYKSRHLTFGDRFVERSDLQTGHMRRRRHRLQCVHDQILEDLHNLPAIDEDRIHAIGDVAIGQALRCARRAMKAVGPTAFRGCRHRIEHVELLGADGADRMAELGLAASVQPAWPATAAPPRSTWASTSSESPAGSCPSCGSATGQATRLMASTGRPPIAYTSDSALAAAIRPQS